jgi:hypothetical protein
MSDAAAAMVEGEQNAALARKVSDRWGLAFALSQLAGALRLHGDSSSALGVYMEAVAIARETGERYLIGLILNGLAWAVRAGGNQIRSAALFRESLIVSSELQNPWLVVRAMTGLASAAVLAGSHGRAARLFGFMEALRATSGMCAFGDVRTVIERDVATTRAVLGDETFVAAWTEGRAMTLDLAVACALEGTGSERER